MSPTNQRLAVFFREEVFGHDTGRGFFEAPASERLLIDEKHPENADRVRNMRAILRSGPISGCVDWCTAGAAKESALLEFHTQEYISQLSSLDPGTTHWLTGTSPLGPGGFGVAKIAAGLAIAALDHVWQGNGELAYALVRPPGHHAQPAMADGYCFINNIGVAIESARHRGLERVAVIDWDVHHGNGTQAGYYEDEAVLTISLHMDHGAWGPTHLQTGAVDEVGAGAGTGKNINLPLPCGAGDDLYQQVFEEIVAPAVSAHQPDLIVVAAGQDASQFDPNGRMCLTMAGFNALGRSVRELARQVCGGRLVLVQEGGYAMSYASYCLHATLEGVLGAGSSLPDPIGYMQEQISRPAEVVETLKKQRRQVLDDQG